MVYCLNSSEKREREVSSLNQGMASQSSGMPFEWKMKIKKRAPNTWRNNLAHNDMMEDSRCFECSTRQFPFCLKIFLLFLPFLLCLTTTLRQSSSCCVVSPRHNGALPPAPVDGSVGFRKAWPGGRKFGIFNEPNRRKTPGLSRTAEKGQIINSDESRRLPKFGIESIAPQYFGMWRNCFLQLYVGAPPVVLHRVRCFYGRGNSRFPYLLIWPCTTMVLSVWYCIYSRQRADEKPDECCRPDPAPTKLEAGNCEIEFLFPPGAKVEHPTSAGCVMKTKIKK